MIVSQRTGTNETLDWLLERNDPGVRYLALRDLLRRPPDDSELYAAREEAHARGPIAAVLTEMTDEGYWVIPGPGYAPKYRGTVWSLILLGQLGASAAIDKRIERGCQYILDHALMGPGQFSASRAPSPSCSTAASSSSRSARTCRWT